MNDNQIRARDLRQIALSLVDRLKEFEESLESKVDTQIKNPWCLVKCAHPALKCSECHKHHHG